MNFIKKCLFSVLLLPSFAFAQATSVPSELMFHGKPIDALCINDPTGNMSETTVSLANCGLAANKDLKATDKNADLVKKGYIGTNFRDKDNTAVNGYSYYKPYGKAGDQVIVFSISSGGGSGEFTSLALIKREGDTIQINKIASGDRCNNGIYDVKRDNNSLSYSVSITPFDYLTLANDNPHNLKAYDDLDACAACCKGSALYSIKIDDKLSSGKFEYVDLSDTNGDDASSTQKYQACFDNLIKDYKQKSPHLNMDQLKEFTKAFNSTCVK